MNQPAKNLITDVSGIVVGNAGDERVKSGVTVVLCEEPAVASVHVMGGAPGTRETDLLAPEQTVEAIDAVVLAGGSAFGLDAAGAVMSGLARAGRGFLAAGMRVPLVPAAILFDLANGGDKDWGDAPPYARLGAEALAAAGADFALGTAGAGIGATTANLKGGLGSASMRSRTGRPSVRWSPSTRSARRRRRQPALLGRALRGGDGVRRPRLARDDAARGDAAPPQGPGQDGRKHDHRRRRHRRDADQGRVQAAGDHGP